MKKPTQVKASPPRRGEEAKTAPASALKWEPSTKNEWIAADGDKGGARIKCLLNGYLGKDVDTYYVYRDGEFLGSNTTLEGAKVRAERRESSADKLNETMPDGSPAFLSLSAQERKAGWIGYERPRSETQFATGLIDMSKYETMEPDQLVKAYNELVAVATGRGLDRFRVQTRFPDRETALRYIENIESSLRAVDSGAKAAKAMKGKGPAPREVPTSGRASAPAGEGDPAPAPKGKGRETGKAAPSSSKRKSGASPEAAKGSAAPGPAGKPAKDLSGFLTALGTREGTLREKLATHLFTKLGKDIAVSELCKAVYGTPEVPAVANVLRGLEVMITTNRLPYTVNFKRKDGTVGLHPTTKA